ncbi:carbohydrate ABC transporter permease [Anaerococcus martiniensis]|uniref:carbohydrate ABC transporter permease n=1 Tax=Anaerococcus sp. WGS1579 TaxID=3366809 RepID=UPI00372D4547
MKTKNEWLTHLILLIFVILMIFPIVFAISNSFKTMQESANNIMGIIPENPTLDSFKYVAERLPIKKIIGNSFFISTTVTIFKLVTSVLAAYGLVYFDFKGKNIIYFLMLMTMFIPFTVTMVPNYLMISKLGLADKLIGVALPQFADVAGIFLIRQAMRTIPKSLIEAAKMDNISDFHIMKDILFPIVSPAVVSSGIMFYINSWNEFVWPTLILKSRDNFTLPLALQMFMSAEGGTDFPIAMAVSVITMSLPIVLYLIFQRYIIGTYASSGVK